MLSRHPTPDTRHPIFGNLVVPDFLELPPDGWRRRSPPQAEALKIIEKSGLNA
ncbi:MAG: hypothetical protein PUP91_33900 [Rhizonema sp. PD37]|nr:hypothetical protein [Rhizonema sp. PD37]